MTMLGKRWRRYESLSTIWLVRTKPAGYCDSTVPHYPRPPKINFPINVTVPPTCSVTPAVLVFNVFVTSASPSDNPDPTKPHRHADPQAQLPRRRCRQMAAIPLRRRL